MSSTAWHSSVEQETSQGVGIFTQPSILPLARGQVQLSVQTPRLYLFKGLSCSTAIDAVLFEMVFCYTIPLQF